MGRTEGNGQEKARTAHRDGLRPDMDAARPMASAAPEDFLPAWEVNLGGRTGLPTWKPLKSWKEFWNE